MSLVLFVLALCNLGTACTGAYFSAAPFADAVVSIVLLHETPPLFWLSALLMETGIWLHVSEKHEPLPHTYRHFPDIHHQYKY